MTTAKQPARRSHRVVRAMAALVAITSFVLLAAGVADEMLAARVALGVGVLAGVAVLLQGVLRKTNDSKEKNNEHDQH